MSYKHPIDTTFISTQIGDSPEIIVEMSVVFLEVLREYQREIKAGIQSNDFASIRLHAHKIKPSLSMFGLKGILEIVMAIEKAASPDEDMVKVLELSAKVEAELPLIYHQVDEIIDQNKQD
ncbi:MAG: Hpt domain-containing protein [Crocinitomicaceae bacterium]|nr:Hpt domain-containing protein [Crocinitomicaceae bacterium]